MEEPNIEKPIKRNSIPQSFSQKLQLLGKSIYIATLLFFKNIPSVIKNRWQRYWNEKKRLPKRKTKSRVYVLVGYTSKEKVDKRYRSMKIQKLIKGFLIIGILVISMILLYRAFSPEFDFASYQQMFGIEKLDDLTEKDPFEGIAVVPQVTPTVSTESKVS